MVQIFYPLFWESWYLLELYYFKNERPITDKGKFFKDMLSLKVDGGGHRAPIGAR